MKTEDNYQEYEAVSENDSQDRKINWGDIAMQTCLTATSAFIGGFAAAGGAFAFSKIMNRQPNLADFGNVVELKSKVG